MRYKVEQFSLTLICLVMAFSSCKQDEPEINNPLIGKWKWTVNERLDCGQDEGSFDVYDCAEYCFEVKLMPDGKLSSMIRDENGEHYYEGSYLYEDNSLKMCALDGGHESCFEGEVTIYEDSFQMFIPKESSDVCDVIRYFEKIKD